MKWALRGWFLIDASRHARTIIRFPTCLGLAFPGHHGRSLSTFEPGRVAAGGVCAALELCNIEATQPPESLVDVVMSSALNRPRFTLLRCPFGPTSCELMV